MRLLGSTTTKRNLGAPSLAALLVVVVLASLAPATAQTSTSSPRLRLISPDSEVTMYRYARGAPVPLDLRLMVAAIDAPLEFRVLRPDYAEPIGLEQVLRSGETEIGTRPLNGALLDGWRGLKGFLDVTFEDSDGQTVLSTSLTFCPNSRGHQRVNDSGPEQPTYPLGCFSNPFTRGVVWGIDKGWTTPIADPEGSDTTLVDIPNGRYQVTARINSTYVDLFGIDPSDSSVLLDVTVERLKEGCYECTPDHRHADDLSSDRQASLTSAPTLTEPDPSILPDLAALPSWGIRVENRPRRSVLSFGATVWVGGASDLVVEGFRRAGEATMDAYQYFYRDGEIVGKAPAGELEFDDKDGHQHWHFKQFAQYSLVDASGGDIKMSRKEAFCLAPTDAIDITLAGASLDPYLGLATACGERESIWIRETLPLGWGDTYFQNLPGQSFDITNLPNDTYYIRVEANPGGALHEQSADNNAELREVILKGKAGQRRVIVPPWNGIDSEAPSDQRIVTGAAHLQDGRIAFIRNARNGVTDAASMTPSGRRFVNITNSKRNELYLDVSPDGRRIAFTRFGRNGGEIYTAAISGGDIKRLTSNKINDELPVWSPDSSKIAFVGYPGGEGDTEIFVMNADGTGRSRVTTNDSDDADPRWSPDGAQLIFNGGNIDDASQDVFLATLGRSDVSTLTEPGVNDTFAEWSPDGETIVYSSQTEQQWDIYTVSVDGTERTQLTQTPDDDYAAEWSPDGTRLLFMRGRLEGELPPDEIYVMDRDGTDAHSISPARLNSFSPEWSPTGNKIAFVGQVEVPDEPLPEWEIFTVGAEGTNRMRLTRTKAEEFDLEWGVKP